MTQPNEHSANYENITTKYDEYILQDENGLNYLTALMNRAMVSDDYEKAIELAEKIASIYRRQGNAAEGGRYEHEAFLFAQRKIYRDAGISIDKFFSELPYVEKLKDAMTEAAELAMKKSEIDYYVCYKKMTARICRAQGKEGDAYMIDCSISSLLERVKNILKYKEITEADVEKQCLHSLAAKCGANLYTG